MGYLSERVRKMMRNFLKIDPPIQNSVTVKQDMDYQMNAFKNRLWYRGKANELNQFYQQIDGFEHTFWGAVPTAGLEIRRLHTGLPKVGVDLLTNIVTSDFNGFEFDEEASTEFEDLWEQIAEENGFYELLKEAIADAQIIGDGAFKISFDKDLSKLPILEWYAGDKVEFKYDRGRLRGVVFNVEYHKKNKKYILEEHYGYGQIEYHLFDGENEIDLGTLDETKDLQDVIFDNSVMLAIPFMITKSKEWKGRGQSVFDSKCDNFDALDEAYSQWWQAMRQARPNTYIPESLIARNPNTGAFMRPNAFDNQFIRIADDNSETGKNEVKTEQPNFPTNDYMQTYITALDLCLQGWLSPSTLGIDVKKLDNAEAQREKEKATLYSRGNIIEVLEELLPALVEVVLKSHYISMKQAPKELPEISVTFGEYANPSFEALVETLSNPNTPMSIEAKVREMWGDSKDEKWILEEVAKIKEEMGIAVLDEPTLAGDDGIIEDSVIGF